MEVYKVISTIFLGIALGASVVLSIRNAIELSLLRKHIIKLTNDVTDLTLRARLEELTDDVKDIFLGDDKPEDLEAAIEAVKSAAEANGFTYLGVEKVKKPAAKKTAKKTTKKTTKKETK